MGMMTASCIEDARGTIRSGTRRICRKREAYAESALCNKRHAVQSTPHTGTIQPGVWHLQSSHAPSCLAQQQRQTLYLADHGQPPRSANCTTRTPPNLMKSFCPIFHLM